MNYLPYNKQNGAFGDTLQNSLQQLAAGIGQNLQQRRQRTDTALGLQSMGIPENQAKMMSGMDPQTLSTSLKQKLLEPSRRSNYELARSMSNQGTQGQNLASSMGNASSENASTSGMGQQTTNQSGMSLPAGGQLTDQQLRDYLQDQNQRANRSLKESEGIKNRELRVNLANKAELNDNWRQAAAENKDLNTEIEADTRLIRDLEDSLALNSSGQLIQGKSHIALKTLGLEGFFTNDPTQLTQKSIENMKLEVMKQNKTGGKTTNDIFNAIGRALPGLVNTQKGFAGVGEIIKDQSKLNRAYKNMRLKVKGEYQKKGLPVPLLTIDEEIRSRMQPYEQQINNKRRKIIGNTIVDANPEVKRQLMNEPEGKKKKLNGIIIQKQGNDWVMIPESDEMETHNPQEGL